MGKPTLESVRRACARALEPVGYQRGKKAAVRDLGDGLVSLVTVEGRSTGWARGVSISVSVHRTLDRLEAARRLGEPVSSPGEVDRLWPFGLSSDVGRLLLRPHDHAWLVEDAAGVDRLQEQLGALWGESVQPHVQRWGALLQVARTSAFLPGGVREMDGLRDPGLMRLSREYVQTYFPGADLELVRAVKQRWLGRAEVCPWAPCAEQGRGLAAGGTWPDDLAGE